jgi:hypothetical protein
MVFQAGNGMGRIFPVPNGGVASRNDASARRWGSCPPGLSPARPRPAATRASGPHFTVNCELIE